MSEQPRSRFVSLRRWGRATFTRDKVLDNLKSFIWVAPLTVLIWIYAEREQSISDYPLDDVTIQLANNEPNRFVAPVGTNKVNLILSGPQSKLETVSKVLSADGISIEIAKILGSNPANGQRTVNVVDRIQDDSRLRDAGVSVVSSQPAELTINIETMQHRSFDVKSPPTITNLDMSKTWFDPKQVTVNGPESSFKNLKSLTVYADLTGSPLLNQPGPHDPSDLPLIIDQAEQLHLTISPPTIKAHLEVLSTDITWHIDSIPIVIQAPPKLLEQYSITIDPPSIANVKATGPKEKQNEPIDAVLKLTNDLVAGTYPLQVKFEPPDGVHVDLDQAASPQPVKVTLTARPSTGGG
jgi:hypothetical protein